VDQDASGGTAARRTAGETVVGRRPALQTVADRPLESHEIDYLGFDAYATALAELIDNPRTATPLTIAISAPWGAGKSSLGKRLESRLRQRARERKARPHAILWFNAWKHDDAAHLGGAFAADVARELGRQRPLSWRVAAPLPSTFLSPWARWWRRVGAGVALLVAVLLFVALVPGVRDVFGVTAAKRLESLDGKISDQFASLAIVVAVVWVVWGYFFRVARAVTAYVGDPRAEASRGAMDDVSHQLGQLVRQATGRWRRKGRRVVIFVDDLERCRPPRAVEVCEVAAQLLAHTNVVVVLLADMSVIAASAEIKYAKLETPKESGAFQAGDYGRLYLQKLIQIEFTLPPASLDEMRDLVVAAPRSGADRKPQMVSEMATADENGYDFSALMRGVAAALGVFSVGVTAVASIRGADGAVRDWLGAIVAIVSVSVVALIGLRNVWRFIARIRAERAENRIDALIHEAIATGVDDPETLEREVMLDETAKRWSGLARQRLRRSLVDDSELRKEATAAILEYLPRLPRSAKRMVNHLRVLLVVAYERGMFGGNPPLAPNQIGKWVVLNERWPDLARVLKAEPEKIEGLENVSATDLRRALNSEGLGNLASEELGRFFDQQPQLGGVLERLVHLKSAAPVSA
jgi:KAP family P-loop domain